MDWQTSAQKYLARLCAAEYEQQRAAECKGRKCPRKAWRYSPSEYARELVALLGQNDERGFKARKGLEGYNSALGV